VITRRLVVSAIAATSLWASAAAPAMAQSYPTRPVKIVVPFAPGGVDVTARVVADRLSSVLGQPFIIENRAGGAGGSVGAKAVATAEADGYTLLFSTPGPVTISPAVNRNVDYDSTNFAAVAIVSNSPLMLVVNPSVPVTSVQELVAYAKADPDKIHFSSPGYGTQPHLLGELFKVTTGARVMHVPYRGSSPAITDLIGGQVQMYFDNVPNLLQYVQAGTLRAIALTSDSRSEQFPNLPTMLESGLDGFVATYWNGVLAPAGTPASVVNKLNTVINEGLRSADMQASLRKLGAEPKSASPQDFGTFLTSEAQKWAAVARAANIKAD
jgi:tripartite-type tricarboxylate transporter receptor subunit TctC